jgi:hypothetical protein
MAETAAARAAATNARKALVEELKKAGTNSLVVGAGVTVVALAVQVTVIAANSAIGAGRGITEGLRLRTNGS